MRSGHTQVLISYFNICNVFTVCCSGLVFMTRVDLIMDSTGIDEPTYTQTQIRGVTDQQSECAVKTPSFSDSGAIHLTGSRPFPPFL